MPAGLQQARRTCRKGTAESVHHKRTRRQLHAGAKVRGQLGQLCATQMLMLFTARPLLLPLPPSPFTAGRPRFKLSVPLLEGPAVAVSQACSTWALCGRGKAQQSGRDLKLYQNAAHEGSRCGALTAAALPLNGLTIQAMEQQQPHLSKQSPHCLGAFVSAITCPAAAGRQHLWSWGCSSLGYLLSAAAHRMQQPNEEVLAN